MDKIEIPLATVSGILTTTPSMIKRIDAIPEVKIITTKSYEVEPNSGNPEPIIVEEGINSFGNAVGLRNPGMEEGLKDLKKLREEYKMTSLLNVSLSGKSIEEFILLVENFHDVADILELNFSCPHAADGYGAAIGSNPYTVYDYVSEIRKFTDKLLLVKLTPNVKDIRQIAKAVAVAGADGITAINTVGPYEYIEPHSGKKVLNSQNGKGGKSGREIKNIALEKIREIREEIGNNLSILGIGGIENFQDVKNMKEAGADVVGIGSTLSQVHPSDYSRFFHSLVNESDFSITNKKVMEYIPYKINNVKELKGGVKVFELNGVLDFDASQFAFIWVPEVGEKPFSIVKSNPLTFIIKNKGKVTNAIYKHNIDDTLYIRGPYGEEPNFETKENIIIVAGGTGIAVVPKLVEKLKDKKVEVFIGEAKKEVEIFKEEISKYAPCEIIYDEGTPARVIGELIDKKEKNFYNYSMFSIGPEDFMKRCIKAFTKYGGEPSQIFASIEGQVRCGVGLCGECSCGGHLTCREGTFLSAEYLKKEGWYGY